MIVLAVNHPWCSTTPMALLTLGSFYYCATRRGWRLRTIMAGTWILPSWSVLRNLAKNGLPPRHETRKRLKRIILARRTKDGILERIPTTESLWYHMYISCPQTGNQSFEDKFRKQFRLPYQSFLELAEDVRSNTWFHRWTRSDLLGDRAKAPLELLLLGSLRCLGRGFTFNDCEESTAISKEVHCVCFHKFIEVGITKNREMCPYAN